MADYNGNLIKVLITGAFRKMEMELDKVIDQVKAARAQTGASEGCHDLRQVEGEFSNPYALAKARAAYEIAQEVAGVNVKGCFMTKEWEKAIIPIVASAHEMMRQAMPLR